MKEERVCGRDKGESKLRKTFGLSDGLGELGQFTSSRGLPANSCAEQRMHDE
jgi:hypothetical protein